MIPQLLEAKVINAINGALSGLDIPIQVFGAWQTSAFGYLKNEQDESAVAIISVAVGTQQRETFSVGSVRFSGAVSLSVRVELDTAGNALLAISERIEALFRAWQGATYQQAFDAFDVEGFQAGDISLSGGNPPQFNFADKTVTVDWPFTISGSDT